MTARTRGQPDRAYADTNLFVVLFAGATHPLYDDAIGIFQRLVEGNLRLVVTPTVMAELVYVAERVFDWSRSVVTKRLGSLLETYGLEVREQQVVAHALQLYGSTRSLDFADAYLGATALILGPPRVASLDADLSRIPGVVRIAGTG